MEGHNEVIIPIQVLPACPASACLQVCKQPIAALGLLQNSQQLLGDANAFAEDKMTPVLPNHLALLHRVACEQPSLIAQVGTRGQ